MLIYNFQKEFIGIDEKDLKTLGFQDLSGLRAEVHDFADLFVKTPGYVHNFKHVHWIDFIACAESNEESKVIINVNNKNYTAIVQIATAYLVDNPSSKGYFVTLHNLRELSASESERISGDIRQREVPLHAQEPQEIFSTSKNEKAIDNFSTPTTPASATITDTYDATPKPTVTPDPYEAPLDISLDDDIPIKEPTVTSQPINQEEKLDISFDDTEEENLDIPLEIDIDDNFEDDLFTKEAPKTDTASPSSPIVKVEENFDNGYEYDPHVASEELGLPLDLIEEFIQDFIEQANDFRDDLYKHLQENDLDSLKILAHKLKGVAANLRIEDALETITIVNTSSDIDTINRNLDTFYKIIAKLSGEKVVVEQEITDTPNTDTTSHEELNDVSQKSDDLYIDPLSIDDTDVPEKIEMPELADDTFNEVDDMPLELAEDTESVTMNDIVEEKKSEEELDLAPEIDFAEDIQTETQPETETQNDIISEESSQSIDVAYSKESVAQEIGLDIESFNELFKDYIEEAEMITQTIATALNDANFETLQQETLKLKGMSENMRVTSFSEEMELLLSSEDTVVLQNALDTIKKTLEVLSNKEG